MASEVLDLFTDLAAIPSPPGEERAVADVVAAYLRDLGLSADEDGAGAEVGSAIGNIFARVEGTAAGTPIFLCAHLDTVPPSGPLEPAVEEGVVRNAGGAAPRARQKAPGAGMLHAPPPAPPGEPPPARDEAPV